MVGWRRPEWRITSRWQWFKRYKHFENEAGRIGGLLGSWASTETRSSGMLKQPICPALWTVKTADEGGQAYLFIAPFLPQSPRIPQEKKGSGVLFCTARRPHSPCPSRTVGAALPLDSARGTPARPWLPSLASACVCLYLSQRPTIEKKDSRPPLRAPKGSPPFVCVQWFVSGSPVGMICGGRVARRSIPCATIRGARCRTARKPPRRPAASRARRNDTIAFWKVGT